jgi:HEAT repeats
MIRSIRIGAFAATLLGVSFSTSSLAQSPYGPTRPVDDSAKKEAGATPESGPTIPQPQIPMIPEPQTDSPTVESKPAVSAAQAAKADVIVIVKDAGKPDRRCLVITEQKQLNGSTTYKVKALDNGDVLFINQRAQEAKQDDSLEMLPAPTVEESVSQAGPAIIPPADFSKVPVAPRLALEHEPESPTAAAPKAEVIIEPIQPELVVPPVAKKPERPSLWKRLFGKPDTASSRQTNSIPGDPKTIGRVAPVVPPDAATPGRGTIDPQTDSMPGKATVDATPGRATIDGAPGRATVNLTAAADGAQVASCPRNQDPVSIGSAQMRAEDPEAARLRKIKELLKSDMLPSHRMTAAEEILQCVPGRIGEVRAALLKSAQEDPAACVRAACIHSLSKLNTRDEDFASLLDASIEDDSDDVRNEANFALEKLKRK